MRLAAGLVLAAVLRGAEQRALLGARALRTEAPACELPAELNATVHNEGWSFLAKSAHHSGGAVVLARQLDDDDELGFLVFDCKTQKRLLFLHIPKNAGTTIEDSGRDVGISWGRMLNQGLKVMPDGSKCNMWHVPPAYLPAGKQFNPYANAEVFCVTRHPYERAVSEYNYLVGVPWGKQHPIMPLCQPLGLNNFLSATLQEVKGGKKFTNDCHMVPQSDYVWGPSGRQWCQTVLKIDHLTAEFNQLMAQRGLSVRLGPKKNSKAGVCPKVSTASLTPATKALINQVYAADFAKLGYVTY